MYKLMFCTFIVCISVALTKPVEREKRYGGKLPPGPATFGGPAVAQKYKVYNNALF